MFFNNFINNIIKSMMAVCVVANGWSMNKDMASSSSQGLVKSDSPIMVNKPPYPAQSPVKRVLEKDSQSQNNTKHHKAASGTRDEIKTSAKEDLKTILDQIVDKKCKSYESMPLSDKLTLLIRETTKYTGHNWEWVSDEAKSYCLQRITSLGLYIFSQNSPEALSSDTNVLRALVYSYPSLKDAAKLEPKLENGLENLCKTINTNLSKTFTIKELPDAIIQQIDHLEGY